jgi:hypothetical protein
MNSRSNEGFIVQETRPWRPPGIARCLGLKRPESLQNGLLHRVRNMSGGLAQSFREKSRILQPQDLHIEGRGGLQEISATLTFRSKALGRVPDSGLRTPFLGSCACHCRDRETARLGHCRLTNRCSGRPGIKCSAAGGRVKRAHERYRARVLRGRRAAAELSR